MTTKSALQKIVTGILPTEDKKNSHEIWELLNLKRRPDK
jgi:hypothetical protein